MPSDEARLQVVVNSTGNPTDAPNAAKEALLDLAAAAERAARQIDTESDKAGKSIDHIGEIARGVEKAMVEAFAVEKLKEFAASVVEAFAAAEDSAVRLQHAFKQQDIRSEETRAKAHDLAYALQEQTQYSHVAIEGAERLLVSMAGLSGNGLEKATKATLDLASGLGIDLNQAALLVAKAHEGHAASLSRYGITVKDASGKTQDFDQILAQVEKKFGGDAAADLNTYTGKMAQLDHAVEDLKEHLGADLAPAIEKVASFFKEDLIPAVDKFFSYINEPPKFDEELNALNVAVQGNGEAFSQLSQKQQDYVQKLTSLPPEVLRTDEGLRQFHLTLVKLRDAHVHAGDASAEHAKHVEKMNKAHDKARGSAEALNTALKDQAAIEAELYGRTLPVLEAYGAGAQASQAWALGVAKGIEKIREKAVA